jgi:short-subunit dehydrogenase
MFRLIIQKKFMQTKNPIALITGASSGIGQALCEEFAKDGYDLIMAARSVEKMQMQGKVLHKLYGIHVTVIGADLESRSGAEELHSQIKDSGMILNALVNNAGYGTYGEFKNTELSATLGMMQLNMNCVVVLTKLFLPDLLSTNGKLLNVASTAAFQPGPFMAAYYATKSFVLYFSEGLACELEGTGVTVTALCPGPTASGFQDKAVMQASSLVKNKKLPSAQSVAASGYAAMKRGKRVHITGFVNNIMAQSIRFTPRNWVTALLKQLTKPV